MARHRNVRNYAYEDEMTEDVYGHSVEEYDMCISPSTAQQFMYNRGNDNQQSNLFGNYMSGRFGSVEEEQEDEHSEEEDHLGNSQDYRRPQLDPISEAKLSSCLDQLQSILGDDCHEPTAVDAILKYNFDAEKALDYIFSKENKKDGSQKRTTKKHDSNLHYKLLKKNVARKTISKQRDVKMGGLQHVNTIKHSIENNNCISEGNSLLSMPLSSVVIEGRKNASDVNRSAESKRQLPFEPLGSLLAGSQEESSLMMGLEAPPHGLPQSSLLSVSVKTLADEQTTKVKSTHDSCSTLSSLCKKNSPADALVSVSLSSLAKRHDESIGMKPVGLSGISLQDLANPMSFPQMNMSQSFNEPVDKLTSTSLSCLAKQHDESIGMKPVGLSGVSLQDLAHPMSFPHTKMSQSSNEPVDKLTSASLSGLAKQHDESIGMKPVGLPGISLQNLANSMPFPHTKMGQSSNESVDMLTSTSLSGLAKQHDESIGMKPVGLPGISLQNLANSMPFPHTKMGQSSNESVDMLTSTSLSGLAKQHDESIGMKPVGLPGISLQDLAHPMPFPQTNISQSSNVDVDQDVHMLSLGRPSEDTYKKHTPPGHNTQGSTQDLLIRNSLSSLASLSLDSTSSRKSPKSSRMNHGLSGKNNSAASASIVLSDDNNSRTIHSINTLQTENENSRLYPKQSKKKVQGSRCEENLLKVSHKTMKKKRTRKISQSSILSMNPSMFARTLCYKSKRRHSFPDHLKSKRLCTSGYHGNSDIVAFNFLSPSPDDIIKMKQQQRFGAQHEKQKKLEKKFTEGKVNINAASYGPDNTTSRSRIREQPVAAAAAASNLPDFISKNVVSKSNQISSTSSTTRSQSSNVVVGFSTPVSPKSRSSTSSPDNTQNTEVDSTKPPEQQPKNKPAKKIDARAEYEKRQQGKELLNLVVIGHVDAGKSTLMGHLLFLLGDVSKKAMHKYETESKKAGKASFAYAWVLDETGEERERGITMDVGLTQFATKSKVITLMDAPGHKDFIPNMITGAAQADVAILVVDSSTGEFEAGFEAGGQTREHALLVRSLGVTQIVVAVNKLDNVDWSEERYLYIVGKLRLFLKQVGFKDSDVGYVPCSGLSGENLAKPCTEEKLKKWYKGSCLLDKIDDFKPPKRDMDKPWRFCVSDVYKGLGAGINLAGKMIAGSVQNGNKALVMPAGVKGMVKALTLHDEPKTWACAGDHVTLTLAGVDAMHVGVGSILCDPTSPVKSGTKLKARIIVFNIDIPITRGFMVLFHYQTMSEPATVKKLLALLNKSTGEVVKRKPRCLTKNSNAEVEIHTSRPVCVELFKDYKDLGRFMLRYGSDTIAAGVITAIL